MPARDLGTKYVCFKCSTKFYDMKKPDPVCPKCGTDQREVSTGKSSEKPRSRLASVPKVIEPVEPVAAEGEEDELEALESDDVEAEAADEDEA